ncbi:hypothetical protein ALP8811_02096 [Aliiroseovarius pelagivivens]|uniref:Uncharacterized protein n=1 Tax=Aliiroseovarius pelagivivens TaxID=1639690 RepID=A0A2R8AMI6_9RHOB|nr:hypothetical protein [Aliiroseovarius pelagivivens]SPF77074.1 hypothetical protein ALP8811_02096 [Aliiroseovarius pelagivivens]
MYKTKTNWIYVVAIPMIALGIMMFKGAVDQQTLFPLKRDAFSAGLLYSGLIVVFSALVFDSKNIASAWVVNAIALLLLSITAVDMSGFDGLADFWADAGLKTYGYLIFLGFVIRIALYYDKSE